MEQILQFKEYGYKSDPKKIIKNIEELGAVVKKIEIEIISDEIGNDIYFYKLLFSHNKKIMFRFDNYENHFYLGSD